MPINRDEFDRGAKDSSLKVRVTKFLSEHRGNAYTSSEVLLALDPPAPSAQFNVLDFVVALGGAMGMTATLDELAAEGKAQKRRVDGEIYYSATT